MDKGISTPLFIANKYGQIVDTVLRGMTQLPGHTFMQPIYKLLNQDEIKEPYRQHVWTYACVSAIALAAQRVPFILIREKEVKGNRPVKALLREVRSVSPEHRYKWTPDKIYKLGFEPVESGPVYELFDTPNPLMCRSQLVESLVILLYLTGATFWVLDAGSSGNGAVDTNELPKEIWPFGQDWFDPEVNKETGLLKRWKRIRRGDMPEVSFEPHQIIRFYKYNPYNFYNGLAPYEVVSRSASQDFKAQIFNENFFDNGATPSGFLKVKDFLTQDEQQSVYKAFRDKHQGYKNAHKMGLLQGDASIEWNPQTHKDMQFLDGRKWNRDESFAGFGVPKMKAAIYEDLQLATALAADKAFWLDTVIPNLHYFEDVINSRLFKGNIKETQGLYCMFDLSGVEALRPDMDQKTKVAKTLFDMAIPFNRINEKLELGFEEIPWGNVGWVSLGMTPIDNSFSVDDFNQVDGSATDESDYKESDSKDSGKTLYRNADSKAITKAKLSKRWIDRVFRPIEAGFQRKIRSYWNELRNHQIAKWNEATKTVKAMPTSEELQEILFNSKEWQDKLLKFSKPFIYQSAKLSIDITFEDLGTTVWEISDPRIQAVLKVKENKIVGITERFWKRLRSSLVAGLDDGETLSELTQRIKMEFGHIASPARTLTIARTETAQVASPVRHIVLAGEGVTKCDWSDSGDDHVRGDHLILNGLGPKPIDHNYMEDLGKPGILTHPSDPRGPADQVINCRCLEIPED